MDNMSQETIHTIPTHGLWRDIAIVAVHGTVCTFQGAIILSCNLLLLAGVGYAITVSMLLLAVHAPDASGLDFLAGMSFTQAFPVVFFLTVTVTGMWVCATGRPLWGDGLSSPLPEQWEDAHGRLRQRIHDCLKRKAGTQ